ncbi:restriction endonuclease subunit S [Tabrizicola soli]|uniref:Restriction endonuclease subunit S n=1 Tax=Tabrizicola soli TaxID=2185115 RepID=A0ABV7DVW9_9RHOB|nr:restriction endonuclease subunit S [Tabrizicola soli]
MTEWPEQRFASLLSEPLRNGLYKPKEFHGRGAKVINMGELFAYPRMRSVPMKRIDVDPKEAAKFAIRGGDLIFARRSLVAEGAGKCTVVLDVDELTVFESSIIRARPTPERAHSLFYYYFFNSPSGMHKLDTIRRQVAVAGITGGDLAELALPVPTLPEQRAIAATLGALDDKIELNRKMNATLEAMARALFRDWFVDFGPTRAKMEGRPPYLSPDLWSLFPDRLDDEGKPEGWAFEPLLDQAEWVNGAAYKNMHFSDAPDALPVIKIAELKNGVTGNTQWTATDLGARYLIDDGELLFSWSGNPDTSIDTFLWTGGKAWLNQHIFAVRPNGKRFKPYLHTLLKHLKPEFAELARNKQTTGLGHVTKADMQRMMVCAASPEVHKAFDRLIEPIFSQALGLQTESRTLAQTRDLLLPRLMSGELRVGDLASFDQEAVA